MTVPVKRGAHPLVLGVLGSWASSVNLELWWALLPLSKTAAEGKKCPCNHCWHLSRPCVRNSDWFCLLFWSLLCKLLPLSIALHWLPPMLKTGGPLGWKGAGWAGERLVSWHDTSSKAPAVFRAAYWGGRQHAGMLRSLFEQKTTRYYTVTFFRAGSFLLGERNIWRTNSQPLGVACFVWETANVNP